MKTLQFMSVGVSGEDEHTHEIYRAAIFELNNLLVIPMKILEIKTKRVTKSDGKERTYYSVDVENCADEKEWDHLVACWMLGFNTKAKLARYFYLNRNKQ